MAVVGGWAVSYERGNPAPEPLANAARTAPAVSTQHQPRFGRCRANSAQTGQSRHDPGLGIQSFLVGTAVPSSVGMGWERAAWSPPGLCEMFGLFRMTGKICCPLKPDVGPSTGVLQRN